ncbi:MAG: hypothetical protein AAFR04_13345, partial [Pseudomonadota bacterium]
MSEATLYYVQVALLMAGAYIAGACFACLLRKLFAPSGRPRSSGHGATIATGAGVAAAGAAVAGAASTTGYRAEETVTIRTTEPSPAEPLAPVRPAPQADRFERALTGSPAEAIAPTPTPAEPIEPVREPEPAPPSAAPVEEERDNATLAAAAAAAAAAVAAATVSSDREAAPQPPPEPETAEPEQPSMDEAMVAAAQPVATEMEAPKPTHIEVDTTPVVEPQPEPQPEPEPVAEAAPPTEPEPEPETNDHAAIAAAAAAAALAASGAAVAVASGETEDDAPPPVAEPEPAPQSESAPAVAPAAVADGQEDLQFIQGIDPDLEQRLNAMGFTRFDQIAAWDAATVTQVNAAFGFKGRVQRENWIEQAKMLAAGTPTAFAARRLRGEAATAFPTPDQEGGAPGTISAAAVGAIAGTGPVTNAGTPAAPVEPAAADETPTLPAAESATVPDASPAPDSGPSGQESASNPGVVAAGAAGFAVASGVAAAVYSTHGDHENGGDRVDDTAAPASSAVAAAASAPAGGIPAERYDDLKRIRGIDDTGERALYDRGITRYSQIAAWNQPEIEHFDQAMGGGGRIQRENWIEQAQILAKGGDTSYSRDYDRATGATPGGEGEPSRLRAVLDGDGDGNGVSGTGTAAAAVGAMAAGAAGVTAALGLSGEDEGEASPAAVEAAVEESTADSDLARDQEAARAFMRAHRERVSPEAAAVSDPPEGAPADVEAAAPPTNDAGIDVGDGSV